MMQSTSSSTTLAPASTLRFIPGAPDDSTPMIRTEGLTDLAAIETPEMRPPPPMGTIRSSVSGNWSMISRPRVPCPAISSGSSKGWM